MFLKIISSLNDSMILAAIPYRRETQFLKITTHSGTVFNLVLEIGLRETIAGVSGRLEQFSSPRDKSVALTQVLWWTSLPIHHLCVHLIPNAEQQQNPQQTP